MALLTGLPLRQEPRRLWWRLALAVGRPPTRLGAPKRAPTLFPPDRTSKGNEGSVRAFG